MTTEGASAFDLADQDAVRTDLARFFGPCSGAYLCVYDRQRARVLAGGKALRLGWSWPAFGGWFVWFWYRKMWRLGALALLLPVVGGAVFPGGDVVGYLLAVSLASDSYVSVALRNRLAAEAQGLTGEGRAAFLAARGGVSWWGGTVGMVLMMGLAVADMTAHGDAILTTLVGAYDQLQAAGVIPPSD